MTKSLLHLTRFLLIHLAAAFLAFLPIAIMPFDDPFLLAGIAAIRAVFGLWWGYLVFCLLWALVGILTLYLYGRGLRFGVIGALLNYLDRVVESIGGRAASVVIAEKGWRSYLKKARVYAASRGADKTFVVVALGPVFSVPILKFWGWDAKKMSSIAGMFLMAWVFGTVWYLWYGGIVWMIAEFVVKLIF